MLKEIINTLKTAKIPLSLDGLSQRLDINKRALEGMLDTLIQKGLIIKDPSPMACGDFRCGEIACAGCASSSHYLFAGKVPKTYTLVESRH